MRIQTSYIISKLINKRHTLMCIIHKDLFSMPSIVSHINFGNDRYRRTLYFTALIVSLNIIDSKKLLYVIF